jgi:NAD(P)-dependent dehydrogenase (short-subunit alcohol dehydrogenase family)
MSARDLEGRVALVAGATRGAGRGIALGLAERGATVYCTGRSTRADADRSPEAARAAPLELARRPETIEESAALVDARGGHGVAVRCDHTDEAQVAALIARIAAEAGRLDLLVNDVWGGDALVAHGRPLWELSIADGRLLLERAVVSHLLTARHAIPLILQTSDRGLVVEVTDGDDLSYRGNVFYDLVKTSVIRLAFALAEELRPRGVAALAITPGFLRSEAMLDLFGVTEATWRDGAARDPHFAASETPLLVGRAVAALAADPAILARSGGVFSSWELARAYDLVDADGARPDWGAYAATQPFRLAQRASHERFVAAFREDE